MMGFPVRCFTCGKVIGHLYKKYKEEKEAGKDPEEIFKELGIERYCCRRMFISHVEVMDTIVRYKRG